MRKFYVTIFCIAWPFFSLFHPCRLIGKERLPEGGGLFCANHSGLSDPVCLIAAMGHKRQIRVMAKAELLREYIAKFHAAYYNNQERIRYYGDYLYCRR